MPDRGQLSLPMVEAAVGALLVLGVTAVFAVGVADPGRERAQLDRYATDGAVTLERAPSLPAAVADRPTFVTEGETVHRRVRRVLPDVVRVRVTALHGSVGPPRPSGVPFGRATLTTVHGPVRLIVWYG